MIQSTQPSLFKGFRDLNCTSVTWEEVYRLITDGRQHEATEKYRYFHASGLSADANRIKQLSPCITPAVSVRDGRRMEHIKGYTGVSMADFDHVAAPAEAMERLAADPHTFLAHVTISGQGIRVFFRYALPEGTEVTPRLYRKAFETGNRHFARLIGSDFDAACKNPARLSVLCHDAQALFHPDAVPFTVSPEEAKTSGKRSSSALLKRAVRAAERQLTEEQVVYETGHRNEYIMRMGYLLNAYGVAAEEAEAYALRRFADYDGDVSAIVRSCYQRTEEHGSRELPGRRKAEEAKTEWATVQQVEQFLDSQVQLRFNVVRRQCEVRWLPSDVWRPITDRDENTLWCRMGKEGKRVRIADLCSVIHSEYVPAYNPFIDYFGSLPPWDGVTDHIGRLARTVHVSGDEELFVRHFRKWLVGMVATLLEQETVNHEIMVFIGRQGNFKSTFFARLLPPELQSYFYTKTNSKRLTKDDLFTLSEFALVCLEEIDEMRPSELNQLKAMITIRHINERAAYGRNKEHRPHIASFCGTGNNPRFLTDPTGNRRWLAAEVLSIDDPNRQPFDYTGIYSQAVALLKSGFRYWFDQEEINELNRHNARFEAPNLEEELIRTHFRKPLPGEVGIFATTAHILGSINYGLKQPLSAIKVGIIMRKLGYENIRQPSGVRGYRVVELNSEEIYRSRSSIAHFSMPPEKQEE